MTEYKGNAVSEGIAIGKVYLYQPYVPEVTEGEIPEAEAPEAIARYEARPFSNLPEESVRSPSLLAERRILGPWKVAASNSTVCT